MNEHRTSTDWSVPQTKDNSSHRRQSICSRVKLQTSTKQLPRSRSWVQSKIARRDEPRCKSSWVARDLKIWSFSMDIQSRSEYGITLRSLVRVSYHQWKAIILWIRLIRLSYRSENRCSLIGNLTCSSISMHAAVTEISLSERFRVMMNSGLANSMSILMVRLLMYVHRWKKTCIQECRKLCGVGASSKVQNAYR